MIRIVPAVALLCCAFLAQAQQYPSKPVRMIMPIPAGSLVDVVGRALSISLAPVMGQPIVAENRVGANGTIGMAECARAAPDGHTTCMTDGNIMTINHFAYKDLPYDPASFVPVAHLADLEVAFVVQSRVPARNLKEWIEHARANPGKVTWGSFGMGSTPHVYLEWFQAKTGVQFNHIPYKGPTELQNAMVAGEVDASNMGIAFLRTQVPTGKVRVIASAAGRERSEFIRNVPTFREQGFDIDFRNWLAIVFPGGTPQALARRWNSEINRLYEDKAWVAKYFTASALSATGGTPEELAAVLKEKHRLGAELAKIANLAAR
jgi:tripartite-type tricarboxylate transporter receptor subunit TctC